MSSRYVRGISQRKSSRRCRSCLRMVLGSLFLFLSFGLLGYYHNSPKEGLQAEPYHGGPVADGIDAVADGIDAVADRIDAVADGIDAVVDRTDAIADRIDAIADGIDAVADGIDAIADR